MKTFLAILVAVLASFSDDAFAQAYHHPAPGQDGVCASLAEASPGLYGLCKAYCEALDCDASEDASTACVKVLENYNRIMNPVNDPAMPCLAPPVECPCFTQAAVEAIAEKVLLADTSWCINGTFADGDYRLLQVLIGNPPDEPYEEWDAIAGISDFNQIVWCNYRDYTWDGQASNEVLVDWESPIHPASLDSYQACVDILEYVWVAYDLPYGDLTSCN